MSLEPWVKRFSDKFSQKPSDYSITAYDAALVVLDAIDQVAKTGNPVTRAAVRDADPGEQGEDACRGSVSVV